MAVKMKSAGQDTQDVEGQHKFDEPSLARYLAQRLPGFRGALTVKKFGYGQSNPTYLLSTSEGQQYVLRKKPAGKLIKGAHAVDREHRIMSVLGQAGFQVPRVHLLCEDEGVIGTSFYVMDFVRGPIMDNALSAAAPGDRRPLLFSIGRALAQLHRYDPAKLGLLDKERPYGRMGGFYERQLATMEKTSAAQVAGGEGKLPPMRSMPGLLRLFRERMPPDVSCIIHGDWKPDNIILCEKDPTRVAAVIDWELSTIGHPMSDLANLCLAYHLPKDNPVGYPVFDLAPGSGIPTEEELHRVYCEAAGAEFPIPRWDFYVAFACLRLAVIIQGVAMRAARGQASAVSEPAGQLVHQMVAAAEFMCDLGYETARRGAPPGAATSRL